MTGPHWNPSYPSNPPQGGSWGSSRPSSANPPPNIPWEGHGSRAVPFSGSGALSFSGISQIFNVPLTLIGNGQLTMNVFGQQNVNYAMSGDGLLRFKLQDQEFISLNMDGFGDLEFAVLPQFTQPLAFAGDGALSIATIEQHSPAFAFGGNGALSLLCQPQFNLAFNLGGAGSLVMSTAKPALMETLIDDFTTKDATKWNWMAGAGVNAQGQASITPGNAANTTVTSNSQFSLKTSYAQVYLVTPPAVSTGLCLAQMLLNDANSYGWSIWMATNNTINFREVTAAGGISDTSTTWDPVNHRFWRIAESGGSILWQTSPDNSTWTTQRTEAADPTINMGLMQAQLLAYSTAGGVTQNALFDQFNVVGQHKFANVPLSGAGSLVIPIFTPFNETNTVRNNQPVPAGCAGCRVTLIGGGGGGGNGASGSSVGGGSGGGGGAKINRTFISAGSLGATYSVQVGTGGPSGASGSGSASSFTSGPISLIAGVGGQGANGASSGSATGGSGGTPTASGVTLNGASGFAGGSGGAAGANAGASGGSSNNGAGPGGGGGGGRSTLVGANGGAGGDAPPLSGGAGGTSTIFIGGNGSNASSGAAGSGGGGGRGVTGTQTCNGGVGGTAGAGGGGGGGSGSTAGTGAVGGDGYTLVEWMASAPNPIAFISQATNNSSSIPTMPTHQAQDLLLMMASNFSNTTIPTVPTGWTTIISNNAQANGASVVAYKLAASSSEVSGTWTNAAGLELHVYRYVNQSDPIGASATANAVNSSCFYPAITLQNVDSTSWVVGMLATNPTNASITPATGMAQRSSMGGPGITGTCIGQDTNGAVNSFAQSSCPSNTSGRWSGFSIEILSA